MRIYADYISILCDRILNAYMHNALKFHIASLEFAILLLTDLLTRTLSFDLFQKCVYRYLLFVAHLIGYIRIISAYYATVFERMY